MRAHTDTWRGRNKFYVSRVLLDNHPPAVMTIMFPKVAVLNVSTLNAHPTEYTTHGISALTIWIKATLRYRYAVLDIHRAGPDITQANCSIML
jgi:hypothetical protein